MTYREDSLNRRSLHFIACKKMLKGQIVFHSKAEANANSKNEWNPFYKIMGRSEKNQLEEHRDKWGDFWFDERDEELDLD